MVPAPLRFEGAPAGHRAVAMPLLAAIAAAGFLGERLAAWNLLGDRGARLVADLGASARLYLDPALSAPWQPWTSSLLPDGWWGLAALLWALLVPGAALERALGTAATAILALAAAGIAGFTHLALGLPPAGPGGDPLGLTLAAGAATALRGARLRWGVPWYNLVAVGWRPLWSSPPLLVAALFLAQAAIHLPLAQPAPGAGLLALALCGGGGLLAGRVAARRH